MKKEGKTKLFEFQRDSDLSLSIFIIGLVGYFLLPVIVWYELKDELDYGTLPVDDSIGLPFGGFILFWIAGLVLIPIIIFVITRVCGTNDGNLSDESIKEKKCKTLMNLG